MPSWGEVLEEIQGLQAALSTANPEDPATAYKAAYATVIKYLNALGAYTNRNTFIYASGWLYKSQIPSELLMVHPSDMDGFMEVVHKADYTKGLDLILHSPGGSPEAAEQIINYLRQKFPFIRVIIPSMAMSAATMMALGADEICMASHSTLGPTDPQFMLRCNTGDYRQVAAHAIKREFQMAENAAGANPAAFTAWAPILAQYPPGLRAQSDHALALTKELVEEWLAKYMLKGKKGKAAKAEAIAKYFSGEHHHTHGRPLMRTDLLTHPDTKSLNISKLEDDQDFQDLVMSVLHACNHLLGGTIATKIIFGLNSNGFIRLHGT